MRTRFVITSVVLSAFSLPVGAQEARNPPEKPRRDGLYCFSVDTMTQGPPVRVFLRFHPNGKLALTVHTAFARPGEEKDLATIAGEQARHLRFQDGKQRGDGAYEVRGEKLNGHVLQQLKVQGDLEKVAFEFVLKDGVLTLKKGSLGILGSRVDKKCEFVAVSFPDHTKDKP